MLTEYSKNSVTVLVEPLRVIACFLVVAITLLCPVRLSCACAVVAHLRDARGR